MLRKTFPHTAALFLLASTWMGIAGCQAQPPTHTDTPGTRLPAIAPPALIPTPAVLETRSGTFTVSANTPLSGNDEAARTVASQFAAFLARSHGPTLNVAAASATAPRNGIRFDLDPNAPGTSPESYVLDINPQGVRVSARQAPGLFYGAVTLWQLLTPALAQNNALPALHIEDTPRFGWRGLMLDSARHFQSLDDIKLLLDAMALHKLNTFHWHLTDDQGWRIEIKKYPRLTQVGGCRIPAGDGGKDPRTGKPVPYCGFYTQQQIREVVAYAAQRHITVVPEIDVPGHAQAAIAAYPQLGVLGSTPPVSNEWGVHRYLFNVEESTFQFMEDVLSEVIDLFPGRYIHIGGDEAVKDQWQASARVQQRMRELGLKDEMAMQSHIIKRLETFLENHQRRLIGWDEILEGGLPPQATVMSWRGIEGGIQAARQGHDVIMAPSSELYLDYLQTHSPNEPPGRPALIPLKQVYAFEPIPERLDPTDRKHILGLQANVWTEHMRSFARVQHAIFPRIAALAETGWSPQERKDYANFLTRLPVQLQRYQALGIAYAQTPFEVSFDTQFNPDTGSATITLSNPLGYSGIRYTTDGSAPTAQASAYQQPLQLNLPAQIRAAVFVEDRPLADATTLNLPLGAALQRSDHQLAMCVGSRLVLRLEDDGPLRGPRALFDVDIFEPCWRWNQAPLAGIRTVQVRAARLPYYFQLAHDEPNRRFKPARTPHGELEIRTDCKQARPLASLPMPAQLDADGFVTVQVPLPAQTEAADLCLQFTGDTRPEMWVLSQVTLLPEASPEP